MTLYGDGTRNEVERRTPERFGTDSTLDTDLIKSMAVSSAELWHDVLQRLTELQASQVLLAQAIAEIGAAVHDGLGSGLQSQVSAALATPELTSISSAESAESPESAESVSVDSVESDVPSAITDDETESPSDVSSIPWTPPVFEPAGRRPKHRRGRSAAHHVADVADVADEETASSPARPSRAERRMAAQESKAADKLAKIVAKEANAAAKAEKASAKGGKGAAITLGATPDEASEALPTEEASTTDKKPSLFKRELSFGRKHRPAQDEAAVGAPAEAHLDLLGSMQSFVVEDPGVFVDTTQTVQLPPPPPPVVTPPPPVVLPPPPVAENASEPQWPIAAPASPVAPQPLVYTPNRPSGQFDVSALDPSPSAESSAALAAPVAVPEPVVHFESPAAPAAPVAVPEPVVNFESPVVDNTVSDEPEPAFVGAPSAPVARESSVTLASEILATTPAPGEVAVTASEPQPLVISEDMTLVNKSRKRKMQFRIH